MAKKKDEIIPFTEDEILDALEPAQKQLRALTQISQMVEAYLQVKSEISGLESGKAEATKALAAEQQKLADTQANVHEEIVRLNASIDEKRDTLSAGLKDEIHKLSDELEALKAQTAASKVELAQQNERLAERTTEIDQTLAQCEKLAQAKLADLKQQIELKTAEFGKIQESFKSFLQSHGIPEKQNTVDKNQTSE